MTTTTTPLIEKAEALAPLIREHAAESEAGRRLATATVEALREAGLFRSLAPRSLDGFEADLPTHYQMLETVARADGSAGWCLFISSGGPFSVQYLPDATAETMLGDPDVIMAGAVFPFGQAVVQPGGFAVTGRWPYASGCQHSSWLLNFCTAIEDGAPRLGPSGVPEVRVVHYPASHATIHDTWDTIGLRGTGSHDIEVRGEVVSDDYTWSPGPGATPGRHFGGPLYRAPFMAAFAWPMASVALGIAQSAIDEVQELAGSKRPAGQTATLRERPLYHWQLADAVATTASARAWLREEIDRIWDQAQRGQRAALPDRARALLAAAHATRSAAHAVDAVYTAGGGTAVYRRSRLQLAHRDVHTLTQHVATSLTQIEAAGSMLSGGDAPNPLLLL